MQSALCGSAQCLGYKHVFRRQQAFSQSFRSVRPPRRQPRTCLAPPIAVSSALALDVGSPSNFQAITNIASAVLLGFGAWWYLKTQNNTEGQEVCPKCRGTGVVECFCRKWSDNDVGCGTCGGSGKMVCNSCNGGGTAVPIEARVHIQPSRPINDSYLPRRLQHSNSMQPTNQKQHRCQGQQVCKACGQMQCQRHAAVR